MPKALITGVTGQDGAYLSQLLLQKDYEVVGCTRRTASGGAWRLERLGIKERVRLLDIELLEFGNVFNVIRQEKPDEIYNLAAMSFVAASFNNPTYTLYANTGGFLNILESVRILNPSIKIYQASTSEMFGKVQETPQKETTPFYPRSPYGVAKLAAYWLGVNYREAYKMFVANGILFNHESPLRGSEFVTKKIVEYAVKYKLGLVKDSLKLGNLSAKRDWGFAGDYVEGMWLMLQHGIPDDFVLATGETHSIMDFISATQEVLDVVLPITTDPQNVRPAEVEVLQGDPSKAMEILSWKPRLDFKALVKLMVDEELKCYNK